MLLFCPLCSNTLIITRIPASHCTSSSSTTTAVAATASSSSAIKSDPNNDHDLAGRNRFECRTCPYQMVLDRRYYERRQMARRREQEVDTEILGGAASWENVDRTEVQCPQEDCISREAYFRQVQIRSADEPMTSFFKCTTCGREWREN